MPELETTINESTMTRIVLLETENNKLRAALEPLAIYGRPSSMPGWDGDQETVPLALLKNAWKAING